MLAIFTSGIAGKEAPEKARHRIHLERNVEGVLSAIGKRLLRLPNDDTPSPPADAGLTAGSFVLTSFFPEKEKAGGGTGVEALLDLRQGEVREVIREEGEEGAAHEGEIGEGVRVARARAVLAPDGVAAPVVADFDAGPVALDEREPLGRSVRGGLGAGEVIADFVGGDGGALHRAGAAHDDHGAGVGEVGGERFEREGVDASGDDAAVAGIGEEKKGVEVWALSASACASSLGWLPLIWSR